MEISGTLNQVPLSRPQDSLPMPFNNIEIPNFDPSDDHTFIISARVGGANQDLFIDNISVTTESSNNPVDPDDPDDPDDPVDPDPIRNGELFISEFWQETTPFLRMRIRKPQTGLRSTMAKPL